LCFGNLDGIADDELVLEDDVKAGDDVPDEILCAQANGQSGEACERGHGENVNADFLRGCQQRHHPDNLARRAVENPGERARLLLSRLSSAGWRRSRLDDQLAGDAQQMVDDEGDDKDEDEVHQMSKREFGKMRQETGHKDCRRASIALLGM